MAKRSLYIIRAEGVNYHLRVVQNQTWGGSQSIIKYDSPGTNGGVSIVTGRTSNTITLTGKLLPKDTTIPPLVSLENVKNTFLRLKDEGKPVVLIAPISNNDTGIYTIENFSGNLLEGKSTYLSFNMELAEYRQSNLRRTVVNLISFEPAEEFKRILEQRGLVG